MRVAQRGFRTRSARMVTGLRHEDQHLRRTQSETMARRGRRRGSRCGAASGLGVCTRLHGLRTRRGSDSAEVPVHAMCAVSKETCRRRSQPPAAVHTGSESSALNAVLAVPDPYTRRRRRHDHPGGKHDEVVSLKRACCARRPTCREAATPGHEMVLARAVRLPSGEAKRAAERSRGLRGFGSTCTTEGLWTPCSGNRGESWRIPDPGSGLYPSS